MSLLKTSIFGFALFASASAFAQGTINFANRITGSIDAKIIDGAKTTGNTGASGLDGFFAQLYVSASENGSFTAVGTPVALRSDGGIGYVVASIVTTSLPGGSTAFVKMAAWTGAATYEAAGVRSAMSETPIQITLGNPNGSPPTTPAVLTGLQGLVVPVPEPTTMALAAIGGFGLLALRRKNA